MKLKSVIILGSSNSYGNTHKVVMALSALTKSKVLDLNDYNISEFDYNFKNKNDDFIPLMEYITQNFEVMILSTPVYWYTMSARMKIFLDRFSDCLKIRKDLGYMLRGKSIAVVSCGSDETLKCGFHMPFKETAKYLGMDYVGDVHGWIDNDKITEDVMMKLNLFACEILS